MTGTETIAHRICPLCEACCGLEVTLVDGAVTRIRGHEADVFSHGYICPKGVALKDLHEDPDRLRTPLIKRDGRFVEATYEEAFAEIERRLTPLLEAHGRDAAATYIGNPAAHKMGLLLYTPVLARALGTRNIYSASTLDQMPKQLSSGLMFGHWLSIPVPDIERTKLMVILGGNPMASNGSLWTVPDFRGKALDLKARGGRLVVIDPRRTETAALADEHHFIRPGSDVFLLAALVHTLFQENLVRLGRLADHVTGVEELRAAVAPFTPERAAAHTAIPADTIRGLARDLAGSVPAVLYGRIGTCTQEFGTLASWLVDVVNVLTGNLDAPGGAMFPKAAAFAANTVGKGGTGRGVPLGRRRSRVSNAPEVFGELPVGCLAEEIETPGEGQVRALFTVAGNPVLSSPNGDQLARALDQLGLMVSVDIYLNETTRHADVILPGVSPFQDSHYDVAFPQLSYRNHARYSPALLPRGEGVLAEWQVLLKLAAIAEGKGADADPAALDDAMVAAEVGRWAGEHTAAVLAAVSRWTGPERLLDLALRGGPYGDGFGRKPEGLTLAKVTDSVGGIDLGALQPRIPEVLRTPSGRIELAPNILVADLARAVATLDQPAPDLVIIGRRDLRSNNSWMHNLPILAKGPFRCTVLVHPDDARRHGVVHGGRARLSRAGRAIEVQVAVSADMMPGVVSLPHGWGHDADGARLGLASQRPGANLNALLDETLRDPLSGNAVLSGVPVTLEPVPLPAIQAAE
ncbi:anaerobic selenocysteine-containing dehydrogenase [Nitrospirillum amazonense]|uniref:Anaerobic selenocysteine-containing dehydrogenase n=1 Tax=Nitrospirillum amazonense TaxID=28077 RepID=A0A560KCT5_9PROT|nr:molybdopterin-dependent oxidoreductase [Nitrospirillum amazonense]TWB79764.1 anaerobic selenocysteine-containing dehydrogenase [Nitrospirillum amazonense]